MLWVRNRLWWHLLIGTSDYFDAIQSILSHSHSKMKVAYDATWISSPEFNVEIWHSEQPAVACPAFWTCSFLIVFSTWWIWTEPIQWLSVNTSVPLFWLDFENSVRDDTVHWRNDCLWLFPLTCTTNWDITFKHTLKCGSFCFFMGPYLWWHFSLNKWLQVIFIFYMHYQLKYGLVFFFYPDRKSVV